MSSPRRKILFLPKWYPDRKEDQNGNFIQQHAQAVSLYADVVVLFANYHDLTGPNLIELELREEAGIPTLYYYYKKRITGLGFIDKPLKLLLYFVCLARGYRLVKKLYGPPDLLHVHVLLRTGLFAWFTKLATGLPYIITEHWTLYMPQNAGKISWLRRKLSAFVIKNADAMHTVSRDLQQAMQNLGFRNRRFTVIPNVVDTAIFHPDSAPALNQKIQLLHVAMLNDRAKNQSGLLRAFHELTKTYPALELRIIGFGPSERELKKLARELGLLDKTVFFEGKKETPEVADYLRRSAMFVLPSFYETFGVVLIEAIACGVPVIASAVGGVPEVFGPEQGILIEPGNHKALLEALQNMAENFRRYDKTALHQYAHDHFSYQAVGRQFADLYETVLHSGKNLPHVR